MKVPTYSKYGLKKFEVGESEEQDRKVSRLLTHTLPLMFGGVFGVIVFFIYSYNGANNSAIGIFYQLFLFGTIGVLCVGIPMAFFIFAEKIYFIYQRKRNSKYKTIQRYNNDRSEYDFWKMRSDEAFWKMLDGLSIEKELINIYMHKGYELKTEFETSKGEYDHVLEKDGHRMYLDFKTDVKLSDTSYIDKLISDFDSNGAEILVIFSEYGFSAPITEHVKNKPVELITIKDAIKLVKEIGKQKQEKLQEH